MDLRDGFPPRLLRTLPTPLGRSPPIVSGDGGRLVTLPSPFGGAGNEFMLTVLRTVFPADDAAALDTARGCGSAEVGAGVEGGRNVVDGARSPLPLGVLAPEPGADLLFGVGIPPVLFLVFATGSAGSATVGGPLDGREGRGNAADMALCVW